MTPLEVFNQHYTLPAFIKEIMPLQVLAINNICLLYTSDAADE